MVKWLVICVFILGTAQKPLPVDGSQQQQQAQTETDKSKQTANSAIAPEIKKENTANAERYAYYKAHPKEYLEAAIAPANLSNWILAVLGIFGGVVAVLTLWTFKRQTGHIVKSERAWIVASLKTDKNNLVIGRVKESSQVGVRFLIKNDGKTHAFILEIGGAIRILETGDKLPAKQAPYDPKNVIRWGGNGIPIPADQTFVRYAAEDCEHSAGVYEGSHSLWVYGYVRYMDVFGDRDVLFRRKIREARYCFRFQRGHCSIDVPDQFVIEGPPPYNRAT